MILDKDAFDPDAVFLDDIVDDDVLPKLTLAVDGLINAAENDVELPGADEPPPEVIPPSTHLPETRLDPEQLEVYGWESSLWRKICGYLGF